MAFDDGVALCREENGAEMWTVKSLAEQEWVINNVVSGAQGGTMSLVCTINKLCMRKTS